MRPVQTIQVTAAEAKALDLKSMPTLDPMLAEAEEVLDEMLEFPRPPCDVCGKSAVRAIMNDTARDARLICPYCRVTDIRGALTNSSDVVIVLDDIEEDTLEDVGREPNGPAKIMCLIQRLRDEELKRRLDQIRGRGG